jgi:hypothetical protein
MLILEELCKDQYVNMKNSVGIDPNFPGNYHHSADSSQSV